MFKRKTKVIDDDDDVEMQPVSVNSNLAEKATTNGNHSKNVASNVKSENKTGNSNSINGNKDNKFDKAAKKPSYVSNNISRINEIKNQITGKLNVASNTNASSNSKITTKKPEEIKRKPTDSGKKSSANKAPSNIHLNKTSKELLQKKRRREVSVSFDEEESEDSSYSEDDSGSSDDNSSSESSSDSDSSSKSQSDKKPSKKPIKSTPEKSSAKKSTPKPDSAPIKKIISKDSSSTANAFKAKEKNGKVLKTKDSLVSQLLKRWWYALPEWPAKDYHPTDKLKELKLREVDISEWKMEPNSDSNGYNKCVEFTGYKYVYIDHLGKLHDLRPKETMPNYTNFMNKVNLHLYNL